MLEIGALFVYLLYSTLAVSLEILFAYNFNHCGHDQQHDHDDEPPPPPSQAFLHSSQRQMNMLGCDDHLHSIICGGRLSQVEAV